MDKICNKCKFQKYISMFSKDKNSKDGKQSVCKSCFKTYNKNNYRSQGADYHKKYYNLEYHLDYIKKNKYVINKRRVDNRNQDPIKRMIHNYSSRTSKAFKLKNLTKAKKTLEMLGCSGPEFKLHLENQFTPGMSWENIGNGR